MNEEIKKAYFRTINMICELCGRNVNAWDYAQNGGICNNCQEGKK